MALAAAPVSPPVAVWRSPLVVNVTCPLAFTALDACNTVAPSMNMTPPFVTAALLVRLTLAVNVTLLHAALPLL